MTTKTAKHRNSGNHRRWTPREGENHRVTMEGGKHQGWKQQETTDRVETMQSVETMETVKTTGRVETTDTANHR